MNDNCTILHGNALEVLKTLPSESMQCAITSPPYYGLRDYKCEPVLWSNHNGCDHEFGETIRNPKADPRSPELKRLQGATVGGSITYSSETANGNSGNFCLKCNAWRGQLGLEPTFQLYIAHLIEIFAEVKRVLKKDGTAWVNLGDSFSGSNGNGNQPQTRVNLTTDKFVEFQNVTGKQFMRAKSLMNIPARFAIAMTDELQFVLRNWIIWHKSACMPSSATDRFTVDFEPIFFFSKNPKYKFNQQLEPTLTFDTNTRDRDTTKLNNTPGRTRMAGLVTNDYEYKNKRTTWSVNFEPSGEEHYASYPTKLVEPMVLAGTDEGDTVLDIYVTPKETAKDLFDRKIFDPTNNGEHRKTLNRLRAYGGSRQQPSTAMSWFLESDIKSGVFVDLGCGDSRDWIHAKASGFATNRIDLFLPRIDRPDITNHPDFIQADVVEHIPLPDKSVDIAISQAMLDLIEPAGRARFFREVSRILKPGAALFCYPIWLESGWGFDLQEEIDRAANVFLNVKRIGQGFTAQKEY